MLYQYVKMILLLLPMTQFTSADNKTCDNSICSYEGVCEIVSDKVTCLCIGEKYFSGKFCEVQIDNCLPNPCEQNTRCQNALGQPICGPCPIGYGGPRCEILQPNLMKKMYVHHNRIGYIGADEKFLITLKDLGELPFSTECLSTQFVLDTFQTNPRNWQQSWKNSSDLMSIAKELGLKHANSMPYSSGYYHITLGKFWIVESKTINIKMTDIKTRTTYFENDYIMRIYSERGKCVPEVEMEHCSNPLNPLIVDVAHFATIHVLIRKSCWEESEMEFTWQIFNLMEKTLLHTFEKTKTPRLQLKPYPLWTRHLGELVQSFMIRVLAEEILGDKKATVITRCYIFIMTKPVMAQISGGTVRDVDASKPIILDGSLSRDYAIAPYLDQTLIFTWTCECAAWEDNTFCRTLERHDKVITLSPDKFLYGMSYNISLEVQSSISKITRHKTTQIIKLLATNPLYANIECYRNCEQHMFVPNQMVHFGVTCLNCDWQAPLDYVWKVNGLEASKIDRLIVEKGFAEDDVKVECVLKYENRIGKVVSTWKKDLSPVGGKCIAIPSSGLEVETEFTIKCTDFRDQHAPLSYEVLCEKFCVERTFAQISKVLLPKGCKVNVMVCDSWRSCTKTPVEVDVQPDNKKNIRIFLRDERNIDRLLEIGKIGHALTIAYGAAKLIRNTRDANFLANRLRIGLRTLLDVEQFLKVTLSISKRIRPYNSGAAGFMGRMLMQLSLGLQYVIDNGEVREFTLEKLADFQIAMAEIMDSMSRQPGEEFDAVQLQKPFKMHMINRTMEVYPDELKFNKQILFKIMNWVRFGSALDSCLKLIGLIGAYALNDGEPATSTTYKSVDFVSLKINNRSAQTIETANDVAKIVLSSDLMYDLQETLKSESILIHRLSTYSNPFWWAPDLNKINTGVISLSGYSQSLQATTLDGFSLVDALELKFKIDLSDTMKENEENHLHGIFHSTASKNVFKFNVPKNAILVIEFEFTDIDVRALLRLNKKPSGYETKRSKHFISKTNLSHKLLLLNRGSTALGAYLTVVPAENVSSVKAEFALVPELRECLSWRYDLDDPSWTTENCWPQVKADLTDGIVCYCKHMSVYAARTYSTGGFGLYDTQKLYTDLPLNWYMIGAQIICAIIIIVWVIIAYLIHRERQERLVTTTKESQDLIDLISQGELIMRLTTGGYRNASTTAGILITFSTKHGPVKFKIYQNPKHPEIKQHSTCNVRFPINPDVLIKPYSLFIKHDGGGRFPSWFCSSIEITYPGDEDPVFLNVNSWIDDNGIQITEGETSEITPRKKFKKELETYCTNWFFYNPLFGPWKYGHMTCNRFERTLIWMLKASVNVIIISLSFGWTTLKNYEEERDKYKYISLNLPRTILMALICFCIGTVIQIGIQFWIFKSSQADTNDD